MDSKSTISSALKSYYKHRNKRLEYARKYYYKNWAKIQKRHKAYYLKNKKKIDKYIKNWQLENEDKENSRLRCSHLKRKYNITIDDYNRMVKQQKGKCKICKSFPDRPSFDIDHNHKTGQIRGLLCQKCNRGLGHFNHNPKILRKAAKYLEDSP